MNRDRRQLRGQVKTIGGPAERVMEVVANSGQVDRQGERVSIAGMDSQAYRANPVVLWAHRYSEPPIGKTVALTAEGDALIATIQFAETEFAEDIWQLYKGGFLNAVSIGFIGRDSEAGGDETRTWTEWELLEISGVPVPADTQALRRRMKILDLVDELPADEADRPVIKRVIPYKETPKAPEDSDWDGPAEVREADVDDLRIMCTWMDAEAPDIKASYKLPHHRASGHTVVWRGVAAAMAALMGGRGGVDIPDGDRRGVYNHLVRHYEQFEKQSPEFRSWPGPGSLLGEMEDTADWLAELVGRDGGLLSERHRQTLGRVIMRLSGVASTRSDNAVNIPADDSQSYTGQQDALAMIEATGRKLINLTEVKL